MKQNMNVYDIVGQGMVICSELHISVEKAH